MAPLVKGAGRFVRAHAWKLAAASGVAIGVFVATAPEPEAHKAITSRFNYNEHIFPIFRDRCGTCHYAGGPTPMSLLTYQDAVPWGESMREELISENMPPWYVDPLGPAAKGGHTLSTKELDMLVTWAVGGSPEGDATKRPAPIEVKTQWKAGPPDLEVPLDKEQELGPGVMEDTREATLSTNLKEAKWVSTVDLLPGKASMVRDALISLENGTVLAAWVPGYDATASPSGTAFKLPAGAKLRVQIHYKKHYLDEQNAVADKSIVGLYFTDPPVSGREIQALAIPGPNGESDPAEPRAFGGTIKTAARVVAVRPSLDTEYESVQIEAVLQGGRRVPLLQLRGPRPEWRRRYWLAEPIELPAGARIEVKGKPAHLEPMARPLTQKYPLQIAIDYVAQ
jgi:hypothetical protein